jgi:P-type E1-E2 ATPase
LSAVLSFAYGNKLDDLCFVGMVGILDPPRPGVRESIRTLQASGVSVKMLTGDAKDTACAIGWSDLCLNCLLIAVLKALDSVCMPPEMPPFRERK